MPAGEIDIKDNPLPGVVGKPSFLRAEWRRILLLPFFALIPTALIFSLWSFITWSFPNDVWVMFRVYILLMFFTLFGGYVQSKLKRV